MEDTSRRIFVENRSCNSRVTESSECCQIKVYLKEKYGVWLPYWLLVL